MKRGRCPRHQAQVDRVRQEQRDRQPGRELYFTARWKERRAQQLAAHPFCAVCGEKATVADHIVPHRGDEQRFWFGALQSLCANCHGKKTAKETWNKRTET